MSLFNAPFERYSKEYTEHYKTYSTIIKERNQNQTDLLNKLELGLITSKEYISLFKKNTNLSKSKLKAYTKKKNNLIKEQKFLGRANFKFWIYVFGIVLLGFYFSLKSLINDLKSKHKTGHEFISISGLAVCLFWFYHLFFLTANDFYLQTYLIFKLFIAFTISFFIYVFARYKIKKENLREIIKGLFSFIITEVEEKGLIKEEKLPEYKKRTVELVKSALDNE